MFTLRYSLPIFLFVVVISGLHFDEKKESQPKLRKERLKRVLQGVVGGHESIGLARSKRTPANEEEEETTVRRDEEKLDEDARKVIGKDDLKIKKLKARMAKMTTKERKRLVGTLIAAGVGVVSGLVELW
ncbi:hypothetical protein HOLleu_26574 [Holothuria leucospilota]|uniref:Uncharacterized protein n=1 Tax=Holothuria leucospilota TaxID=206669 RepID=A0A9Q1BPJ0_HOLLE|nr:hypothetical protein HOLleu_26574 [Holothuria leucospilota]